MTNLASTVKKLSTFDFSETVPYTPVSKRSVTPFVKINMKSSSPTMMLNKKQTKQSKHIITTDIRYIGYTWYLEPIIDTHNNHDYIIGWKLYSDSVNGPIVSEQIVEGDVNNIETGPSIFRSRAGIYYEVYNINNYFYTNIWNPSDTTRLKDLYQEHKLIAYANVKDIIKSSKIEYIEYIKPVKYTIHKAENEQYCSDEYLPAFLPDHDF